MTPQEMYNVIEMRRKAAQWRDCRTLLWTAAFILFVLFPAFFLLFRN